MQGQSPGPAGVHLHASGALCLSTLISGGQVPLSILFPVALSVILSAT